MFYSIREGINKTPFSLKPKITMKQNAGIQLATLSAGGTLFVYILYVIPSVLQISSL